MSVRRHLGQIALLSTLACVVVGFTTSHQQDVTSEADKPVELLEEVAPFAPDMPRPDEKGPDRWYTQKYTFKQDWFTHNIPSWLELMRPYQGRPDVHYLEVGLHEGRSAIWMLEHVLTHKTAKLTGIDLFMNPEVERRWLENAKRADAEDKVITLKGYSDEMLRPLPFDTYDIIYIDGSHLAMHALADAVLSWKLLKMGGLMIFDDYGLYPGFPDEQRPATAVDAFITTHRNQVQEVHRGHQVVLRKIEPVCSAKRADCVPIGPYLFHWWDRSLVVTASGEEVEISESEATILGEISLSKPYGRVDLEISPELAAKPGFVALCERLKLKL